MDVKTRLWKVLVVMLNVSLLASFFLGPARPVRAAPTELFFSEYIEGSSYNKALEIYNGTGVAVDLAAGNYSIEIYFNGNTTAGTTILLTGVVADSDVYVVADDGAAPAILAEADQTSTASFFNGDDAVALVKDGVIIDVVGQIGFDPGSEWGSGDTSTQDNTLRRKSSVEAGDPDGSDPFDPAVEWDGYPNNTFDGLGFHEALDYTPIHDIQYTADPGGDSPLVGEEVTTEGIVTARFRYGYFIEDPAGGAWNGLWVYDSNTPAVGDRVRISGVVDEYYNLTEIRDLTGYEVESSGNPLPDPEVLPTGDVSHEQWEGVLVRVENVTVTDPDLGYGEWSVNDGSGDVIIDDKGDYTYTPVLGDAIAAIIGPLDYHHGAFKIQPRDDDDIILPGPAFTPIHDIQYTEDPSGDSPYVGQTVTTQGVVTAFFYDGHRRFFVQDAAGPWSGLFLYEPNGFLNLGDLVEVTGEVSEYYGLTEIANGEATVLSSGNPLPDPEVLPTGDVSQEQWESVLVRVENVTVVDEDLGYGEWLVDDGSGGVRVDDLGDYSYTPSNGDLLDFVQGPLYYSYDNFKIEPRDDDDLGFAPPLVSICEIQGDGFASPYDGQTVRTQGVVFADFDQTGERGFFIQHEDCDGDPATSDGVFVYKGNQTDVVSVGDLVEVRGTVQEYYDLTEISTSLNNIAVLSSGNPLPEPADLNPPFDDADARAYLEALEGMYVRMDDAAVVGPTSRYDETWVVRSDLGLDRVFQDDPAGTGEIVGVDDGGLFEIAPEAKVGDQVLGLLGAMDYSFETYKMQLVVEPTLVPAPDPPKYGDADGDGDVDLGDLRFIHTYLGQTVPPAPASADLNGDGRITGRDIAAFLRLWRRLRLRPWEFSVATFNLENLFDTVDEPDKEDPVPSATDYAQQLDKLAEAIHDELREPTLIAVQEAENLMVLADLAARPEIEADYGAVLVDGPDGRGIDVGLLYRTDRVTVLDYEARQGCTTLVDGFGPDGNRDPENPFNEITCDSDGDGVFDGNRLFSRPPLVVHLQVHGGFHRWGRGRSQELWVIVNHFKSKGEDTIEVQYTLPRRIEQATFVAGLAEEILAADPGADLIVLGDLNDFLDSEPLAVLTGAGLSDLLLEVPKPKRYTYVYHGVSEVLDHVLISPDLWWEFVTVVPAHINADYPVAYEDIPDTARRSSDHDPVVVRLRLGR